ncbi:E3 ubiquitin-protein ligase UPL5-like [Salvia hispanica]|uniref:E3 ubiquitin-protein ligase UPL5-like n=1 Tax=Salvia hispanica TaxID=49212 RepID=UPI002009C350|nr:E3 ubiquitin-protein ligase UPL5-like [Salvia hispanica]
MKRPVEMWSFLSKRRRKVDDFYILPINPIRMEKEHSVSAVPPSSRLCIHVSISDVFWDHRLDLYAAPSDTIKSIHHKIHLITGIPVTERRLFYRGVQLHWEQTLDEFGVHDYVFFYLIGRMRSTKYPRSCELINEAVSFIFIMCKENPPIKVHTTPKLMLQEFLSMIPRADIEQACGHLKMFSASSAPTALVMLYMSPFRTDKSAADEAIRYFLTSIKSILPKHMHHECVPIIFEFCKLLKEAAGVDDPLYRLCRSSLGLMMEYTEVGKKAKIEIPDIFPFVEELAAKLSHDLVVSMESAHFRGITLIDISDFSSFVAPLVKEIKGCDPIVVPLTEDLRGVSHVYRDELRILYGIFHDLLSILESCLGKLEDRIGGDLEQDKDNLCIGFSYYLEFMKELNSISKIYNGCEALFWEAMKKRKGAFCKLVVKCAKRGEDHSWIFDCKEVTNFEARAHLAMMMFLRVKDENDIFDQVDRDDEEQHEMLIDRSHLLTESSEYMKHADIASLRAGLFIQFKNEEATGPGVLREWLFLVCQEIFNPQSALFVASSNDRRRFYPNPASKVDPMHLEYFGFTGKVIALALMHNIQVGVLFDRLFFMQLAGRRIALEDIRDADPLLYNSCKQILEMGPEAIDQDVLGLTFVHEVVELGTRKTVDLCTNGKSIAVNSENRRKYVDSLIQHRFVVSIAEQVERFAKGFVDIMGCRLQKSFFKCLEPEDLDWMLHGSESAISVDDWKSHTKYDGFNETDDQISWFWKIVGDMTAEQKKILLFFWTSIKYLPIEGFSGLASQLCISKSSESCARLPSSHTCFYRLSFPAYSTIDLLHDYLSIITQEHVGCSFGIG